jgi:CRP/FNR family transcriptional regulator, cyclic AMP receptor protein
MLTSSGVEREDTRWSSGAEGFFKGFCAKTRSDFELLATYFNCPATTVLIYEEQKPSRILFLLEGEVNISMNASDGRRLLIEVAGAGETLGITSAISGDSSAIRAEARRPCGIASLERQDFLDFLVRHPIAGDNVARELCLHYTRACERLRVLGLASSAMAKLAHLILEWCRRGQQTTSGIEIRFALSHGEIGEYIGACRETVSRTLADFKDHDLVRLRGSILIVTSRSALANYASIDYILDRNQPAA